MRVSFERQLNEMHDKLVEMFSFVEKSLKDSSKALITKDKDLAREIIKRDKITDEMEKNIESLCTQIILRQQPVASDLRRITSTLKIITDLERIGDQTEDIAEIILMMSDDPLDRDLPILNTMYEVVTEMLKQAIDSFIVSNLDLAMEVKRKDDIVDELFDQAKDKIIESIKDNTQDPSQAIDLLQIAKYLERIGDHSENIVEWVIYTHTGEHKDFYNNQ
ncbi:MAG: phosphate signaling complex protein PhoU [Tissierellia bacterium]|nr:phosphate signaling complex protein PhoU [Tissierellia bacterium]